MRPDVRSAVLLLVPLLGACNQTAADGSAPPSPGSQVSLHAAGIAAGFDPTGLAAHAIAAPQRAAAMEQARQQLARQEERLRVIREIQREFADAPQHPQDRNGAQPAR
jgi:hypothetical protein